MAISLKTSSAWAETVTDPTAATLVGSPVTGDRYYLWVVWKAFGTTCSITSPQAWTEVTEYTDGAVAAGANVGSVKVACYYRDWQSGDGNPSIDWSAAPAPAVYVMELWQKGAGESWNAPLFATAPHATSAGPVTTSATSGTTVVPDSSVVFALWGIRDDTVTFSRPTTGIDVASGITWNGNYVESPAAHITTTTSNDIAADLGHRLVTTGGTVTLRASYTALTATETGALLWVVQSVATTGPKISTFRDDLAFEDTDKWYNLGNATVTNPDGRMWLAPQNDYNANVGTLIAYDLTESAVVAQIDQIPNAGNGSTQFWLGFSNVQFQFTDAYLFFWSNSNMRTMRRVDAVETEIGNFVAWSSTNHRWVRIRHSGTTVFFDTSPNGINWTNLSSETADVAINLSAMYFNVAAGFSGTEPSPGFAIINSINYLPPVVQRRPLTVAVHRAGFY